MPELAEVEVVRRNLSRWWRGRSADRVCILDEKLVESGESDALQAALKEPLKKAGRRGKYLFCHMACGQVLVFHFRMTGKIVCGDKPDPKYGRLSWHVDGAGWLVFKDQRRLGHLCLLSEETLDDYRPLKEMGPEPEDISVDYLRGVCSDRRLLKTALLDQSIVAGVGNIAVSELYWRLRFAPEIKCGQLDEEDWRRLVEEMPLYFEEIIEKSMSDEILYIEEGGTPNDFQVYARFDELCSRCGGTVDKRKVGGRTTYYCPECQRKGA